MTADQKQISVTIETSGNVAVIAINNPPVNAASAKVRQGLLEAISTVARRDDVKAAVIIGSGRTFIAGADIKEFDKPLTEPQIPSVIAAIEACPKPVIAAIHGAALGGGFEIAMGCDARIAAPDAVVGLPETRLGVIPGAGGTQRLPRLVGVAQAIEIITSGRHVPAPEAAELGMVDRIVDGDLRTAAIAFAEGARDKRRLSQLPVPPDPPEQIEEAARRGRRGGRGIGAIEDAITAVQMAATEPFGQAVAREREMFQNLRAGPESAALRYLFFAERSAGRVEADRRVVTRVAVAGLGLMGSGIAASFAAAGFDVLVGESDADRLAVGADRAGDVLDSIMRRRPPSSAGTPGRIVPVTDLSGFGEADLIVEAVVEDMAVKEALFTRFDAVAKPGAILASNTSYLDIAAIARATTRPGDVAGLHFFSPAHIMRLVEVVRADETAPDVLATLTHLARRLGKLPVIAGNRAGFIGNRILAAYRAQCDFLLEDGAYPEEVDRAMTDFGFAMGPFAVSDMAGLDIAWRMRKATASTRDPQARYVDIADQLCETGRFGRKTGAGWYRYPDGRTPEPDETVRATIDAASAQKGIARRTIDAEESRLRVLGGIINEACLVLEEGVAERASDIDLVLVNGYGFPAEKGGPIYWAARQPRQSVLRAVDAAMTAAGAAAQRADTIEAVLDGVPR